MIKDAERQRTYHRDYMRRRYQASPEAVTKYNMAAKHGPGIIDAIAAMWSAQDGTCYLCSEPLGSGRQVHIDHDHRCCGKNRSCAYCRRGLACHRCNTIIGMAGDDPVRLRLIADRLEAVLPAVTERLAAKPLQMILTTPA